MNKTLLFCLIISYSLLTNKTKAQTEVTFYTTMGNFVVKLYDVERPITTTNFISLVKKKFYDKIIFHRVIKDFMIQGGDPKGDGTGGSGVTIKDEFTPPMSNAVKTIAMANSGPNTGSSQFFINVVDNKRLDPKHPAFGIVISNYAVVDAISKVATKSEKPVTPVVMDSVRITSIATSIKNEINQPNNSVSIFPNPVTSESLILLSAATEKIVNVSIYNQLGQTMGAIKKSLVNGTTAISLKEIQTNGFAPGVYYLMVQDGRHISQEKFIVLEKNR
ncbi:MAG: peptidylprolyl isomerase [Bacteroidia bacterium]